MTLESLVRKTWSHSLGDYRSSAPAPTPTRASAVPPSASVKTSASENTDALLERHRIEAEESRHREGGLKERVETLERLLETARRTVLDREERLRQAEAGRATPAERISVGGGNARDGCEREDASRVAARGVADGQPLPAGVRSEIEMQDFFGAQEWWLHLAVAEKRRDRQSPAGADAAARSGTGGVDTGKEVRRLQRLLEGQGLEVVALRQTVLKVEMAARAKAREAEERATEDKRQSATLARSLETQALVEKTRVAELEGHVAALRAEGDIQEALGAAREDISAAKLALMRAEGDAKLHAQLLVILCCLLIAGYLSGSVCSAAKF